MGRIGRRDLLAFRPMVSPRRLICLLLPLIAAPLAPACGNDNLREPMPLPGGELPGPAALGGQGGAPYLGDAVVVPGTIEAEAFVAAWEINQDYDEQDATCTSAVAPDVDILPTDEGGCAIGYTGVGEWWEYEVYSPQAASYDLQFRVATEIGARLEVSVDGEVRGSVQVPPNTWADYGDVTLPLVAMAEGEHTLRITVAQGATNFDWFSVLDAGECLSDCGTRECGVDRCGNSCGSCAAGLTCSDQFSCLSPAECAATCGEQACGLDACGNSCGSCAPGLLCTPTGQCWDNSVTPVKRHGQLRILGTKIVDGEDEVTQLKGVSSQWLNWEQKYSTSLATLEWLRDNWGLSVFRIANGVEGSNGYLTEPTERLDLVRGIIDNAIAAEVYVIVDWHTHEPEHLEEAKAFFATIAEEYGDQPNIIYEPFNEPLQVDWSSVLKPYHEAVIAEIRKHDPDNIIVVGTPRWDQLPQLAVDDPIEDENVAYALHFYACTHRSGIRAAGVAALQGGLPVFVTEWGATHADGGTAKNPGVCEESAREWHQWLEDNDVSWAAWKLSSDGDASALLSPGASVQGGWSDDDLNGHAYLVREFMLDDR